ncbi:MAG TPA: aminotransferase class IV [Pyrinomonadaceae bacterium]|nr:aminotransferase class IV [Pyrinomonadaceae bacterium]
MTNKTKKEILVKGREIVSINGEIYDLKDGKISVLDHCFLYGDGIFEGIRFNNGKVLFHREHMQRLYTSAEVIRLPMISEQEYESLLFNAIKASNLSSGYLRVIVTRGIGALDINPQKCTNSKLVIIVANLKLYPEEFYEKGLKIIVAKTTKIPYTSFDCRVKSCNYLNNIMATWEFIDRGASEAIQTDEKGIVSEATVDNIFGIKGNTLFTPSTETNCLEGITRTKIMEIANQQKMNVEQGCYTPHDFMFADEVFLTGTGAGVIPVTQIEHKIIGNGLIGDKTRRLREIYESNQDEYSTSIYL